ncbi:hypothetical protein ACHHYP_15989 [Achlya hypogyna]|uniref:FYVE-type domain-containing protein n=1 Tax=Achlya hypogyna TaxID=1202772 RepID=A0A1V9ZEF3_ACHHY|nr:hypothetical protein ACHHYP_15989 [Achlya hypogyna]
MRFRPDFHPTLTSHQREHLDITAKKSMQDLLQVASTIAPASPRLRLEMLPPLQGNPDVQSICASVTLQASLEDIEAIMASRVANTSEIQAFAKSVETHVKASAILLTLGPSMTVNWAMIESQSSLMRHRDFVYLQRRERTVVDGSETWVSVTHSVKIDGCPALEQLELVRGGLYASGYVFSAHPTNGTVKATYILSVDFKGRTPHAWSQSTLKHWCSALGRMAEFFDARHLGRLSSYVRSDMEIKSSKNVAYCNVCGGDFYAWSKKDNCRVCGEVVCPRCTEKKEVTLPAGVMKLPMCTVCLHSKFSPEKLSPLLRLSRASQWQEERSLPPRAERWSQARLSPEMGDFTVHRRPSQRVVYEHQSRSHDAPVEMGDFTVQRRSSQRVLDERQGGENNAPVDMGDFTVQRRQSQPVNGSVGLPMDRAASYRQSRQRSQVDRASFEEMQRVCQPRLSFEADGDVDLFDKVF